ncbi:hypothetical protein DA69_06080 [Brevundimonas naejangsanensis]|uniref:Uncharacterized protein n=1 Tax=Brevundimonas naejangsanensis TaxID=588932 RepID=A0A172Y541_9CAUL|nr:hypothetical protein DA69_06080 [Brevundimonas naejangsanensis]
MTTVPVTAPLVAVPAIVELAIVPIPVPTWTIRPVRAIDVRAAGAVPVRTVRAVGVWTIRTVPVGPIGTVGTRRPRSIRTVRSFRPLRTVRTIGAARLVRLIPVGTVGTLGPLSFWTIRAVGPLMIRALARGAFAFGPLRARAVRRLGARLIGTRLHALARGFVTLARPHGHIAAIALRRGAAFRAAGTVLAGLGAFRALLGQGRQGGCGGHEEGGNRREHEKRTFHGQSPRTPRLGGLNGK